eukprot:1192299-Prorocentrum_minimum.AAC.3
MPCVILSIACGFGAGAAMKEEILLPKGEPDIEKYLVDNISRRHLKHYNPASQGMRITHMQTHSME